jgi:hypothetical protein
MKTIRLLALATLFLPCFTCTVVARGVAIPSYQELLEKSDLVVLATPTANSDTTEQTGILGQRSLGVETRFTVSAVFKGDKTLKEFIFHHYRIPDDLKMAVANGPTFVSFAIAKDPTIPSQTFILFLIKEADGRYAPAVGQTDPGGAVRELNRVGYADDSAKLPSNKASVVLPLLRKLSASDHPTGDEIEKILGPPNVEIGMAGGLQSHYALDDKTDVGVEIYGDAGHALISLWLVLPTGKREDLYERPLK